MTPAEMESRIVRYGDLTSVQNGVYRCPYAGVRIPKENFTIIGGGVIESADQHVTLGHPRV